MRLDTDAVRSTSVEINPFTFTLTESLITTLIGALTSTSLLVYDCLCTLTALDALGITDSATCARFVLPTRLAKFLLCKKKKKKEKKEKGLRGSCSAVIRTGTPNAHRLYGSYSKRSLLSLLHESSPWRRCVYHIALPSRPPAYTTIIEEH